MLLLLMLVGYCFAQSLEPRHSVSGPADDICIGCICEGASGCNTTLGCEGNTCGLFKITWAFWSDAGKPVLAYDDPSADGAWVRCATDPYCAAQTAQQYFDRFKQDCNGDGRIDCIDFAAIHQLGPYGCTGGGAWNKQFEARFRNCLTSINSLNG